MTLPPLKRAIIGGRWHLVVELDLRAESLESTVGWLADMTDLVKETVERESYQRQHRLRVDHCDVSCPEMTGEGYGSAEG